MKKLIIPAFMAMALLASCGGAKTQNTESASGAAAESAASGEQTSLGVDKNLTSPDLSFFELHGPVKNVKIGDFEESDNYRFIEFTGDGRLYTFDGDKTMFKREEAERVMIGEDDFEDLPAFKRNGNGEICEIINMESSSEYFWKDGVNTGYKWYGEGVEGEVTYTYDKNGDLVKACEVVEGDSEESCVEYEITKRDQYGNWTERIVHGDDPWTEKRAIEYYE